MTTSDPSIPDGRRRFVAEYADVVGIPFEFMPAADAPTPVPPEPKTPHPCSYRAEGRERLRMVWPQVADYLTRGDQVRFWLNPDRVAPLPAARCLGSDHDPDRWGSRRGPEIHR